MNVHAAAIDERALPPQMRRIVRAIGVPGAFILLRWRGGRRLKLPRDAARSEIAAIVGEEALEGLLREFGSYAVLTLPKVDKMILQVRNRQMRAEHAGGAGKSIAVLAGLYGLSARHVLNILHTECPGEQPLYEAAEELRQLSLWRD